MLESRFDYMFKKTDSSPPYFQVPLISHTIELTPIKIGDVIIEPYIQNHGVSGTSLGFIFNRKFAYSTDVATMEPSDLKRLKGIQLPLNYKKKKSTFVIKNDFTKKLIKNDIKNILKKIYK